MKVDLVRFRVEPALKQSFAAAARFNHQTLSQFLVQAGIQATRLAIASGCKIKHPPHPRDGRRKSLSK